MVMTTTQTAGRVCDYCKQPANGATGRVVPGDKSSPCCAFGAGHENCRRLHNEAIDLQAAAEEVAAAAVLEGAR